MARKKGTKKVSNANKPKVLANNASLRPLAKRRNRRRPTRAGRTPKHQHVRAVCSITDPFCPASKNSKWPDGTSGNTLTEQFRGNYTLSSDAAGSGAMCFKAEAPFGYIGATLVSTTATWQASWSTYRTLSMLETYGSDYRIVSAGVIVRATASATDSSGLITFGTGAPIVAGGTHVIGTELFNEVVVKAIQPGLEFSWISQPGGTLARSFQAQSTNSSSSLTDWTALIIEVSGAKASTALINIEWFVNVEFLPKMTSRALTALAKPNPPKSSSAEQAVSAVHSSVGSFIEGGIKSVEQTVANAASSALTTFMDDPLDSLAALFAMF
jgi:hypothetical protein